MNQQSLHKIDHQYIDRKTSQVFTEQLYADKVVNMVYNQAREYTPALFRAITSSRFSSLLGFLNYDANIGPWGNVSRDQLLKRLGIDIKECIDSAREMNSLRKIFERKISYWERRPADGLPGSIYSPADSRMLLGSFNQSSLLFLKGKFFDFIELFNDWRREWVHALSKGDYAIFRLTPEKYHYNHVPVSGKVVDYYEIDGDYHACNPSAVVAMATPYSKNKRVVTIIDTDVEGGTNVGYVAMIEVVALMIGDIVQCYSEDKYDSPLEVVPGLFVTKGQPKSLFRPGSSTVVLVFEKNRVEFAEDLVANMNRVDVSSRYSTGFQHKLVETEVQVRSTIGAARHWR